MKKENYAESRIDQLTRLAFSDIPYSAEASEARKRINCALQNKCQENGITFECLMKDFAGLTEMACLAGYSEADVKRWRGDGQPVSRKALAKHLKAQSGLLICGVILLMLCAESLLLSIGIPHTGYSVSSFMFAGALLTGITAIRRRRSIMSAMFWAFSALFIASLLVPLPMWAGGLISFSALAAALAASIRTLCKEEKTHTGLQYDAEAHAALCSASDKAIKRGVYALTTTFLLIGLNAMACVLSIHYEQSKPGEVSQIILSYSTVIEISLATFLYQLGKFVLTRESRKRDVSQTAAKHLRALAAVSFAYWASAVAVMYFMPYIFIYAVALYVLGIVIYNFTLRRRVTHKNLSVSRKRVIAAVAILTVFSLISYMYKDTWYTQPYINTTPIVAHAENRISYNEENGVYTITASEDEFRILQLTDIHLGGSLFSIDKDLKALDACYRLIDAAHPDLIIVTGDLCYPVGISSLSFNNRAPIAQFAAFMRNTGVPWAFTYGNHDTESFSVETDLNSVFISLSYFTSGNLLYPYKQPDITGRSNQLIEIRNNDGTLNQALFLIDSNSYLGGGFSDYDYIHDDQVDWYASGIARLNAEEGRAVSSLAFFHIPLQQYRTAYELYEAGSDEVTWFFGENNESMYNKVCCSDYPSRFFDVARTLGSTKAMFCGHDHFNNMSIEYEGIRLTYGMSIDYLATPGTDKSTAQRGGTLITLHRDSTYDIAQIPWDSIR